MKAYAGIGSRETPKEICDFMTQIAKVFEAKGYTLYSGAAQGADAAFEAGVSNPENKNIFLPWPKFNDHTSSDFHITEEALKMAKSFHPNWDALRLGGKKLQARTCNQILGPNLDQPVKFVICWTKNAKEVGGTEQALRMAKHYNIKIYNLADPETLAKAKKYVEENK